MSRLTMDDDAPPLDEDREAIARLIEETVRLAQPVPDKAAVKRLLQLVLVSLEGSISTQRKLRANLRGARETIERLQQEAALRTDERDALARRERRWRSFGEDRPASIAFVDSKGEPLALIPAPTGGIRPLPFEHLTPADREVAVQTLARARGTGQPQIFEATGHDASGEERSYALRVIPVNEDAGEPWLLVYTADTTERQDQNDGGARSDCMETLERLAANVAHDINTPIQFIAANSSFLESAFSRLLELADPGDRSAGVCSHCLDLGPAGAHPAHDLTDVSRLRQHVPRAIAQCLEGAERIAATIRSLMELTDPRRSSDEPTDLAHLIAARLQRW